MILGYIVETTGGSIIELSAASVNARLDSVSAHDIAIADPSVSLVDSVPAEARVGVFAINKDEAGGYSIGPVAIHAQVAQVTFFIGE